MGHLHLVSPVEAIFLTPVESQERFFVYVLSPSLSVRFVSPNYSIAVCMGDSCPDSFHSHHRGTNTSGP